MGHSTGGLTLSLWLARHPARGGARPQQPVAGVPDARGRPPPARARDRRTRPAHAHAPAPERRPRLLHALREQGVRRRVVLRPRVASPARLPDDARVAVRRLPRAADRRARPRDRRAGARPALGPEHAAAAVDAGDDAHRHGDRRGRRRAALGPARRPRHGRAPRRRPARRRPLLPARARALAYGRIAQWVGAYLPRPAPVTPRCPTPSPLSPRRAARDGRRGARSAGSVPGCGAPDGPSRGPWGPPSGRCAGGRAAGDARRHPITPPLADRTTPRRDA